MPSLDRPMLVAAFYSSVLFGDPHCQSSCFQACHHIIAQGRTIESHRSGMVQCVKGYLIRQKVRIFVQLRYGVGLDVQNSTGVRRAPGKKYQDDQHDQSDQRKHHYMPPIHSGLP